MEWISCKDALPTENGEYLVTYKGTCGNHIDVVMWANNLYQVNKYDFPKDEYDNVGGFYYSDSEWGYIEDNHTIAWCKVEPYEGE